MNRYTAELNAKYSRLCFQKSPWFYRINSHHTMEIPPEQLLQDITRIYDLLREDNFRSNPEYTGAITYMKIVFLADLQELEHSNMDRGKTVEWLMNAYEGLVAPTCTDRTMQKLDRVRSALEFLETATAPLSVDLLQEVHRQVAQGIFEGGGQYRQIMVAPKDYPRDTYCLPDKIAEKMSKLVDFWNCQSGAIAAAATSPSETLANMVRLAAVFFCEFLRIHPFSNGNGRTARLILQYLLRDHCFTPFSVYAPSFGGKSSRDIYLDLLHQAQIVGGTEYDNFATYLLFACNMSAQQLKNLVM